MTPGIGSARGGDQPLDPSSLDEGIRAWNPLMETVRKQMSLDVPLPSEFVKKRRLQLWFASRLLAGRSKPGMTSLGALAVVLAAASVASALRPGGFFGGSSDLADVVAGIGAATAFSALVVGAMAIPAATSIELGPGYTTDLATRRGPWLLALVQVLLMVGLFLLSAHGPTLKAATVGALSAGSLFAASWLVGFQEVASGDPLSVAQREARKKRAACRQAIAYMRRTQTLFFPRGMRGVLAKHPQVQAGELQILRGFLMHLRAGVTSTLEIRQPSLAYEFWCAQVDCFLDYAAARDGRVGGDSEALGVLIATLDEMADRALRAGPDADQMVFHALRRVDDLVGAPYTNVEYRPVRGRLLMALEAIVKKGWSNDTTVLASGAVTRLGTVGRVLMSLRAHDDVVRILGALAETTTRARDDRRIHISLACAQELSDFVPLLVAGAGGPGMTRATLPTWTSAVTELTADWPSGSIQMNDPHAFFLGGVTLAGRGVQQQFWAGPWDPKLVPLFVDAIGVILEQAARRLQSVPEGTFRKPDDALGLLYGLAHRLAPGPGEAGDAVEWASKLDRLLEDVASPLRSEVTQDPELAQLVWSVAITSGFLAGDGKRLGQSLRWLREDLDPEHWNAHVAAGLGRSARLLAGDRPDEVDGWVASTRKRDPFPYAGLTREREGLAPAVNLNMISANLALAYAIEAWADAQIEAVLGEHQGGAGG